MAYIDIILLALIAVFLVLRLRSILGERSDEEKNHKKPSTPFYEGKKTNKKDSSRDNVVTLDIKSRKKEKSEKDIKKDLLSFCSEEATENAIALEKKYSDFSAKNFLQNAESAFSMILTAYADQSLTALKKLLSPSMYKEFQKSLSDRKKAKHSMTFSLVRVEGKITKIDLKGKKATIHVCFNSEQVNVVYNEKKAVVDGDPKKVELCEDTWVFEKDMSTKSPIWLLSETL